MFLAYASLVDMRTGSVSNKFWQAAVATATMSLGFDSVISEQPMILIQTLFSVATTFVVALGLFRIGMFGGSDAKALIMVSLFKPTGSLFYRHLEVSYVTSMSTLVNTATILALILGVNLVRNLHYLRHNHESLMPRGIRGMLLLLLLYKHKRTDMDNRFHCEVPKWEAYQAQTSASKNGEKRRERDSHKPKAAITESSPSHLASAMSWTPLSIPLIPVITVSLLLSLLFGDMLVILTF
jgi:Flp pilus assembly protein protease CpaA